MKPVWRPIRNLHKTVWFYETSFSQIKGSGFRWQIINDRKQKQSALCFLSPIFCALSSVSSWHLNTETCLSTLAFKAKEGNHRHRVFVVWNSLIARSVSATTHCSGAFLLHSILHLCFWRHPGQDPDAAAYRLKISRPVFCFGLFLKPPDIFFEIRNQNVISEILQPTIGVPLQSLHYVLMFFNFHIQLPGQRSL